MDKWSILRSLHHTNAGHSAGDQICFTGYPPGQDPNVNIYPSCGSVVAKQLQHLSPELPAYVMIPRHVPGTDSAYLGVSSKPFETQADPANDGPFNIPNFSLADGISVNRLGDRKELLKDFDRLQATVDPPVEQIVWYVDGHPVAVAGPPYVSRWPLEPGDHWIEARLPFSDVRSRPVRVLTR